MIELTTEQHAALERGEFQVRDAASNETYVLVRQEVYARLIELHRPALLRRAQVVVTRIDGQVLRRGARLEDAPGIRTEGEL